MRKLIIIGYGGHAKVLTDIAERMNHWSDILYLDDKFHPEKSHYPVIGSIKDIELYIKAADYFVGIGNNIIREKITSQLNNAGAKIVTLIHPESIIGSDVFIGRGTALMAGSIVNSSSCIGEGVILNTGSTVDHDCEIENYVHISPGVNIAGNVSIKRRAWIGIGSSVINNINICEDVVIGAGATVVSDVEYPGVYIGIPAKKI